MTLRGEVMERGGTGTAVVTVRRDGEEIDRQSIATGVPFSLTNNPEGHGRVTHAEAKDVLAGAMLKFARSEAEG